MAIAAMALAVVSLGAFTAAVDDVPWRSAISVLYDALGPLLTVVGVAVYAETVPWLAAWWCLIGAVPSDRRTLWRLLVIGEAAVLVGMIGLRLADPRGTIAAMPAAPIVWFEIASDVIAGLSAAIVIGWVVAAVKLVRRLEPSRVPSDSTDAAGPRRRRAPVFLAVLCTVGAVVAGVGAMFIPQVLASMSTSGSYGVLLTLSSLVSLSALARQAGMALLGRRLMLAIRARIVDMPGDAELERIPNAACIACWHPIVAGTANDAACSECGFAVRASRRVATVEPSTLGSARWHAGIRQALWVLLAALVCGVGLAAMQGIELALDAVDGPALGEAGRAVRIAIDAIMLLFAVLLMLHRLLPRSIAPFLLAAVALTSIVTGFLNGQRSAMLRPFGASAMTGLAAQCVLSFLVIWIAFRIARRLKAHGASFACGIATLGMLPLAIAAIARILLLVEPYAVDALLGYDDYPSLLQRLQSRAPWALMIGRHLWEVPAIIAVGALIETLRGEWRRPWMGPARGRSAAHS